MKVIVFFLLLSIAFSYDAEKAVRYARKYCLYPNPNFHYYYNQGGDDANFVSQCLKAGGLDLNDCPGLLDDKGCLLNVSDLKSCLTKKGWKSSNSLPKGFRAGYPVFVQEYSHAMIASQFNGNEVKLCQHSPDRCDRAPFTHLIYFYE